MQLTWAAVSMRCTVIQIQIFEFLGNHLPGILLPHLRAGPAAKPGSQRFILNQGCNGSSQFLRGARRDQQPIFFMVNDIDNAAGAGGDDGKSGTRSFEKDDALTFSVARLIHN